MKHIVLLAALLLTPLLAFGDSPPLVITPNGYFYLRVDANGAPIFEKVGQVVTMGAVTPVPPGTVPDPPPPIANDITTKAKLLTIGLGDFKNAQSMGLVYTSMADHLKEGDLNSTNVWKALVLATDMVLEASDAKAEWVDWRKQVSQLTADLTAQGRLTTAAQVQEYLRSVAMGLETAVPPESEELSLAYGLKVMEICNRIVDKTKAQ